MAEIGKQVRLPVSIREEGAGDISGIRDVLEQAFDQPFEADLVEALRSACDDLLSLVALVGGRVVGHVLFSPVSIARKEGSIQGMGLAPLAVLPEYQRRGVGSQLVQHGLVMLKKRKCPYIIVLGHPDYYPRFGFQPASHYGIRCQWQDVPGEAFMILVHDESALLGVSGVARYRDEFTADAPGG